MNQKDMELFLISGFLGSGKTSFMRSVLTELPNHKIGVIVNDFGSVNIDGKLLRNGDLKLVEINNGSVFCACLKGGFIKTLAAFLEVDVDYLFVEASGLADPDNMDEYLQAVYMLTGKKGKTKRRYSYRGNICVADAVNFLDYLDVFPVIENQARKSRFILLNKEAEISAEEKEELRAELKRLNPKAFIYETNYGKVPPEILTAHLIPEQEHVSTLNTPYNRPCVLIVTMAPGQEQTSVEGFCRRLAPMTIRMKGFVETKAGCLHIEGVGDRLTFSKECPSDTTSVGRLVMIGQAERFNKQMVEEAGAEATAAIINIEEE